MPRTSSMNLETERRWRSRASSSPESQPQQRRSRGDSVPAMEPGPRGTDGCLTCRYALVFVYLCLLVLMFATSFLSLRKKKCSDPKLPDGPYPSAWCRTCTDLGIECLGYGIKRPKWMKGVSDTPVTPPALLCDSRLTYLSNVL